MTTIKLPDGYNGNIVECESEPIEKDGDNYKLRVKDSYLIRWCSRQQWEDAMYKAYEEEAYASYEAEAYASYEAEAYHEEERRQKYQQWLEEENND